MKISFIGSGKVGAAVAYTAALMGLADDIVLTDASETKAQGEALDILQAQAFTPQARIRYGNIQDTAGSDIIAISAGIPRKADEPRVLLLSRNAGLIASLVKEAVAHSPNAILFMITNPLDVMTQLAYQVSGLPASRVIGMGTVLDTSRYRSYLAAEFGVDARDIDAYVIGEHGETMVPVVTGITVKGIPLSKFHSYSKEKMARICEEVKAASGQVIALKGGTVFAPAAAACAVLEAIVRDSRQLLPVCTYQEKHGVAVSLPTLIGRQGASQVLEPDLNDTEREALELSIANIRSYAKEIE